MALALSVITRLEMQFRNFVNGENAALNRPQRFNAEMPSASEEKDANKASPEVPPQGPSRAIRTSYGNRRRSYFVEYTRSNMG